MKKILTAAALALTALLGAEEEFLYGACFHYGSGTGNTKANVSMAKQMGINAGRDEFLWLWGEWVKGKYSFNNFFVQGFQNNTASGILNMYILAYGSPHYNNGLHPLTDESMEAYTKYGEEAVTRFKDNIQFFQIWNEWEGGTSMNGEKVIPTSQEYVRLLKYVAPRIRKAHPDVKIVANSISSGDQVLAKYLELGVLDVVDCIAMHTYNFTDGPGRDTIDAYAERLEKIRGMIRAANNGRDFPVLITEMGMPTAVTLRVGKSQEEQAAALAQMYLITRMFDYVKGFWWYDFQDDNIMPESTEANFGLIRPDTTPKQSAYVMADIAPLIRKGKFVKRWETEDKHLWILQFELDGKDVLAVFHTHPEDDYKVVFENSGELKPFSLRHAGRRPFEREWGYRDWLRKPVAEWNNRFSVTVQGLPVLMEGDFSSVKVVETVLRKFPRTQPPVPTIPEPELKTSALPAGQASPVNKADPKEYRCLNGTTEIAPGFAAEFTLSYDEKNIYLDATVDDLKHFCNLAIEDAWACDSIQLALQSRMPGFDPARWLELDSALTQKGPETYVRRIAVGSEIPVLPAPEIKAENGKTHYRLVFPGALIGIEKLEKGQKFAFSIIFNDNNGVNRRGYLRWANGIGGSKDPVEFGLVELK